MEPNGAAVTDGRDGHDTRPRARRQPARFGAAARFRDGIRQSAARACLRRSPVPAGERRTRHGVRRQDRPPQTPASAPRFRALPADAEPGPSRASWTNSSQWISSASASNRGVSFERRAVIVSVGRGGCLNRYTGDDGVGRVAAQTSSCLLDEPSSQARNPKLNKSDNSSRRTSSTSWLGIRPSMPRGSASPSRMALSA